MLLASPDGSVNIVLIVDLLDICQQPAYSFLPMRKKSPQTDEEGFALVLTKLTRAEIARGLEIKKQNLTRWKRVPPHHVAKVSELSGLSKAEILPSMFA
jgi:hypothetical protein